MLWTIVVILLVLWLLGFTVLHVGSLIHLLLVIALVVVVVVQRAIRPVRQLSAQLQSRPQGDLTPIQAVPLYGSVATYSIVGVTAGQWHVFVSAPGFQPQTQDVEVPASAPLVFNLVAAGVVVPDLFGVTAQDALTHLAALNLNVDVILDVLGHEVPKTTLPPQYQNQPILDQLPPAGTVVDPTAQRLRLVVATALEQAPVVTMPSLVGLSYDEVASVLDGLGLKVGKTTVQN